MALLISLLGLFALSLFTISQRTKAFSQSSRGHFTAETLFDFLELHGFNCNSIFASRFPTYYFLNDWLNGFKYRVDIPLLIFLLAGLGY